MPKMKTKRAPPSASRSARCGSIKRGSAYKRHILTKKTTKRKRQLRGADAVHATNRRAVECHAAVRV